MSEYTSSSGRSRSNTSESERSRDPSESERSESSEEVVDTITIINEPSYVTSFYKLLREISGKYRDSRGDEVRIEDEYIEGGINSLLYGVSYGFFATSEDKDNDDFIQELNEDIPVFKDALGRSISTAKASGGRSKRTR